MFPHSSGHPTHWATGPHPLHKYQKPKYSQTLFTYFHYIHRQVYHLHMCHMQNSAESGPLNCHIRAGKQLYAACLLFLHLYQIDMRWIYS